MFTIYLSNQTVGSTSAVHIDDAVSSCAAKLTAAILRPICTHDTHSTVLSVLLSLAHSVILTGLYTYSFPPSFPVHYVEFQANSSVFVVVHQSTLTSSCSPEPFRDKHS